jgi:aryl-alcohol dehydrogenase-like predicted oxidoreductase
MIDTRMDQRKLGQAGVSLSLVGLGGFELGSGDAPTLAEAVRVVETARDAGVNWLDTAEAYFDTGNESFIGELLQRMGLGSDDLLLSTKLLPKPDGTGFRAEEVHRGCRASLAHLGRDRVDIYLLHAPDETGVPLEETWGAMGELVDQGLVRAIGLSNFELDDVTRCHDLRAVDLVQDGLSIIDHLDNREPFAGCRELGIGVVVYEPLGSGALSGRSIDAIRTAWAEYSEWGFYKRLLAGENGERSSALVDALRPVAERHGVSIPQLAIAWVLHQDGVTSVLAGSTNPDHVRANAAAADLDLSEDVLGELEALIPLGPTMGS